MEMKQISDTTIKITIKLEDLEERGRFSRSARKDRRVFLCNFR